MVKATRTAVAAGLVALTIAGCGSRIADSDRVLVEQFFAASRLRDLTALRAVATVVYEPLQQGIVRRYDITKVETDGAIKHVTIAADVAGPDGQVVSKTIVILMERNATANRWLITSAGEP